MGCLEHGRRWDIGSKIDYLDFNFVFNCETVDLD